MDINNAGSVGRCVLGRACKFMPRAADIVGLALLAACTSAQSQMETRGEMLPRLKIVIVDRFAASPDEVQLDERLSTEIEQTMRARSGTSRTEQELEAGHKVAGAIADKLVAEVQDMGLTAERGSSVPPGVQNALLIAGQLVSIDEGNRTERVIVVLGAGRSHVEIHAQVYEVTSAGRQLIDQIEVDGKSGLAPGVAETMGAEGLAGHLVTATLVSGGLHVADGALGANTVADSDRVAAGIAKQLATPFAQQGWMTR